MATIFLVATMLAAGVDVLFEQNGARNTDFRRGVSLGRRDHPVSWAKSKIRPEWMTAPRPRKAKISAVKAA